MNTSLIENNNLGQNHNHHRETNDYRHSERQELGNYAQRIIVCLVTCDKPLGRTQIEERTRLDSLTLTQPLIKLITENIIVRDESGLYKYSPNFLSLYQSRYSFNKVEMLMKLLRDKKVDLTRFRTSEVRQTQVVIPASIPAEKANVNENEYNNILRVLKEKMERLRSVTEKISSLESEIESLKREKTNLETELTPSSRQTRAN